MRIIRARRIDAEPIISRDVPCGYRLIFISIHNNILPCQTGKENPLPDQLLLRSFYISSSDFEKSRPPFSLCLKECNTRIGGAL